MIDASLLPKRPIELFNTYNPLDIRIRTVCRYTLAWHKLTNRSYDVTHVYIYYIRANTHMLAGSAIVTCQICITRRFLFLDVWACACSLVSVRRCVWVHEIISKTYPVQFQEAISRFLNIQSGIPGGRCCPPPTYPCSTRTSSIILEKRICDLFSRIVDVERESRKNSYDFRLQKYCWYFGTLGLADLLSHLTRTQIYTQAYVRRQTARKKNIRTKPHFASERADISSYFRRWEPISALSCRVVRIFSAATVHTIVQS